MNKKGIEKEWKGNRKEMKRDWKGNEKRMKSRIKENDEGRRKIKDLEKLAGIGELYFYLDEQAKLTKNGKI